MINDLNDILLFLIIKLNCGMMTCYNSKII